MSVASPAAGHSRRRAANVGVTPPAGSCGSPRCRRSPDRRCRPATAPIRLRPLGVDRRADQRTSRTGRGERRRAEQAGVQPEGFTTVRATSPIPTARCARSASGWPNDRGARPRTDGRHRSGRAAGMAFVFDPAMNGSFYMFQTPTPLSIAWFAADGPWVGSAEMEPCLDKNPPGMPAVQPGRRVHLAVEAFASGWDGLDELVLVDGSAIELLDGHRDDSSVRPPIHDGCMTFMRRHRQPRRDHPAPGRPSARSRYRGAVHIGPAPATGLPAPSSWRDPKGGCNA